jgi:hypothetical protein
VIYAVGIPMAALTWQGALTPRGLGLKSFPLMPTLQSSSERWGDDIGWFALLTTTTLTVIILGDWSARAKGTGHPETHKGGVFPNAFPGGLSDAAIEAVVHQAHWAFYREPFVVNWGLELGSWLGVMPVLLETVVNLMFWERIETDGNNRGYMRQMLIRGGLLAASTHLYLKTQSLWLAILMDIVVGWLLLPSSPAYMRSSFSHQSGDDNDSVRVDAVRIA